MRADPRHSDMAVRLRRIAIAADRRADSIPANDPEQLLQRAMSDLAMDKLARLNCNGVRDVN